MTPVAWQRDLAEAHQRDLDRAATGAASNVVLSWAQANPADLDAEWASRAESIVRVVGSAQVEAAAMGGAYVAAATESAPVGLAAAAWGGVTRDGRDVGAELFSGVTYTKELIGRGMAVGDAFRAGTALMSLLAANVIRDSGRSAGGAASVASGHLYSVRVVQPGACSRCAILAGVTGYRTNFQRHPSCRCTSMPLRDGKAPDGFFTSPEEYFDSLTPAEQDRVFTKAGAWAIRNGASPISVVNARRGMATSAKKYPDGTFGPSRIRPVTIGRRADGSPLRVYTTTEGTTARGAWGRKQALDVRKAGERYRRTSTIRLMPESIMTMSQNADDARRLLRRYGYIN